MTDADSLYPQRTAFAHEMLPSPFYPAGSYSNGDGFSWPTADDDLAGSGGDVLSGQAPHPGADQTAYG